MSSTETYIYDDLFFEYDQRTEPRVSYLVCSMPRSGSSLLCQLLGSTGHAGAPAEFFHPEKMKVLKRRWGVADLDAYLRELLARRTSPNGVFGIKAHWGQYQPAVGEADPRPIFPNVHPVSITRRDRLRQAVSWVRALQTLQWNTEQAQGLEHPEVFDFDDITQKLVRIDREEDMWDALFDRYGLEVHRVVYEDLVGAQEQTVREVLDAIGVHAPANLDMPPPVLDRQADELSEEWVERYLSEASP
jgi:trehalose 2-sulfotransferase